MKDMVYKNNIFVQQCNLHFSTKDKIYLVPVLNLLLVMQSCQVELNSLFIVIIMPSLVKCVNH